MSRGPAQSYPGFWLLSKTRELAGWDRASESRESAPGQLSLDVSTGWARRTLSDETLRSRQLTVLMAEPPACLAALVHSARKFCRARCSWRASRLSAGARIRSMRMMTILSLAGWSRSNGRPGSSTTENARLRRPWKTT